MVGSRRGSGYELTIIAESREGVEEDSRVELVDISSRIVNNFFYFFSFVGLY